MKKSIIALFAMIAMLTGLSAEGMGHHHGMKMPKKYQMVPMNQAQLLQKGEGKMFCPKCGMTLPMFYRTNHAAKVDGKVEQFCSMHCLVEEMKAGKKIEDIKVVDNTTLKFIPAKSAWYVVGSKKPATMSKVSKYAFSTKEAAQKFAKEFGGKVMSFEEALKIAQKDYENEAKMITQRQAMMAKKGEQIYKMKCKQIDKRFKTPAEAKSYITSNNMCGALKGKALQAVGLYLSGHAQ